jgi:hypothetical protein
MNAENLKLFVSIVLGFFFILASQSILMDRNLNTNNVRETIICIFFILLFIAIILWCIIDLYNYLI